MLSIGVGYSSTPDCLLMFSNVRSFASWLLCRGIWNFIPVIGLNHQSWFLPCERKEHPPFFSFLMTSEYLITFIVLIALQR